MAQSKLNQPFYANQTSTRDWFIDSDFAKLNKLVLFAGFPCLQPPSHLFLLITFFGGWGWNLRLMEVPRLGVELKLQLLDFTTSMAMPDPSHICNLHCSLRQRHILNQ